MMMYRKLLQRYPSVSFALIKYLSYFANNQLFVNQQKLYSRCVKTIAVQKVSSVKFEYSCRFDIL